ncbi:MAG: hypothetical protein K9M08_08650 [Pirellula sp.]|nr:hypothetical protein [Pirellula sp.]
MSHSPKPVSQNSEELLERGRLTLRAIQYREQAALYRAEATSLQAAMLQAEKGDVTSLEQWLDLKSGQFFDGVDPMISPALASPALTSPALTSPATLVASIPLSLEAQDLGLPVCTIAAVETPEACVKRSPWARMERAALARLGAEGDVPEPSAEKMVETLAISESLRKALEVVDRESPNGNKRPWWRAAYVWVSLVLHAGIVLGLSAIIISAVKKPQILSIVSAAVEADSVLTEAPMEMISELETTATDATPSTPNLNMSDMVTDVALPSLRVDVGTAPFQESSASSSVLGAASEMAHAMLGSNMVAGAEFFGAKATGNTFVYVVDSSPSMRRDGAFEKAKNEMMRSLTSMKPKQRYFISFFGKEIDPMTSKSGTVEKFPVYAKPENISQTIDWMRQVQVQKDGWPPNEALAQAIAMQPDGIFLLFDGDTKVDVAKFLRRENRTDDILSAGAPKVAIHVIHFFQDEFQKQMKQVAEENGGTYRFVPRPERPSNKKR